MSRIYLAATYDSMIEMRLVSKRLQNAGHEITAQWINGNEEGVPREAAAIMDCEDLDRADMLVAFSNLPGSFHTGGGRHVEFGIALALRKRIVVVGPKGEHIFHYMPGVRFVDNVYALIEHLKESAESAPPGAAAEGA